MSTSQLPGVSRIVLLGTKIHAFTDIIMDGSTQMAGKNGVGKTSTINALQMLYIASETRWAFGYGLSATKDFYFPPSNAAYALVLFEVRTPSGPMLVIVRRPNSLLSGLQYFVAPGKFDRADFLDGDNIPRVWDVVKVRLGSRGRMVDITNNRQQCLTGRAAEADLPNLALVPLANQTDAGTYEHFTTAFVHLLRLSDMNQAELQAVLIDFATLGPKQREVDLGESVSEELASIRAHALRIERLAEYQQTVLDACSTYEEMLRSGHWLTLAYHRIHALRRSYNEAYPARLAEVQAEAGAANAEIDRIKVGRRELDLRREPLEKGKFEISGFLERLAASESAFAQFQRPDAEQEAAALDAEVRAVRSRIVRATDKTQPELAEEKSRAESEVERLTGDIDAHQHLLVTWLRERFSAVEMARLFAILSPTHLRAHLGDEAIIVSEQALQTQLRSLLEHVSGSVLSTDSIRLSLDTDDARHRVDDVADVARLQKELARQKELMEKLAALLADAGNADLLEAQATRLDANRDLVRKRIADYDRFLIERQEAPLKRGRLEVIEGQLAEVREAAARLDDRAEVAGLRRAEATMKLNALQKEDAELRVRFIRLKPVAVAELPESPEPEPLAELVALVNQHEERFDRYERQSREWENLRRNLERELSEIYSRGATPRESLKILRDEVSALDERRSMNNGRVQTLLTNAVGQFKQMESGLQKLEREVRRIKREFAKVSISGIESVRCEIVRNKEATRQLQDLINLDSKLNLFDDRKTIEDHFERILANRVYRITDYFVVKIVIKPIGQSETPYTDFSSKNASNGQVITLKILFNFLIIRSYLRRDSAVIPFYLDEIGALDAANFAVILNFAREMGFEGVYTAPQRSPLVRRSYAFQQTGGPIVVTDECSQVFEPKAAAAAP